MRSSGVHWFYSWRVFPTKDGDETKFRLSIEGVDCGELDAKDMREAVRQAEKKVEEFVEKKYPK